MAWFKGKLYLTDGDLLYCLENDVIRKVSIKSGKDVPTGYLHASPELLLSVAPKDMFITTDGQKWDEIPT